MSTSARWAIDPCGATPRITNDVVRGHDEATLDFDYKRGHHGNRTPAP